MSPTALLFLAAFGVGALLSLARHPIYGLMTYMAVFYIHPPSRWWAQGFLGNFRWIFLAAGLTLLSVLIHRSKLKDPAAPTRSPFFWGAFAYVMWLVIQSFWALDPEAHAELLGIWAKYLLVICMICWCVDTEKHVNFFLWTHVVGCFYLGWLAFTMYSGGRFEGFGDSSLGEANAGALQLVTGAIAAGSLFLTGDRKAKIAVMLMAPFILNGIVTTESRSGFLAAVAGGLLFNVFCPPKYRTRIRVLSVIAVVGFAALASQGFWNRMQTMKYAGADVQDVDTGGGRLEIIAAQWQIFQLHPMGCGHMCTTVLSRNYLEDRFLSGGAGGARASHNTYMTMLVDHGIPGVILHALLLYWIYKSARDLLKRWRGENSFLAGALPSVVGVLAAISVADFFVQYPRLEVRVWFLSLLIVMLHMAKRTEPQAADAAVKTQPAAVGRSPVGSRGAVPRVERD